MIYHHFSSLFHYWNPIIIFPGLLHGLLHGRRIPKTDWGIFRRYAQDIKTHFGNVHLDVSRVGGKPYLAFATGTVEPIMIEINSSLPLCSTDPNTAGRKTCATAMTHHVAANKDLNNTKVVFLDPNDQNHGPQLNTWDALCINNGFLDCPTPSLSRPSAKELARKSSTT